jgi:hypothetical protein
VELLVAKGGEVQHAEDAALRTACAYGHGDVVKVLLNSGEQRRPQLQQQYSNTGVVCTSC